METAKETENKEEVEEVELTFSDKDGDDEGGAEMARKKAPQKRTIINAWCKHCQNQSKVCAY